MKANIYVESTGGDTNITIELDDDQIERLFYEAFGGYCPACLMNIINDSEVVCCACLERALAYHHGFCDCLEEDQNE